MTRQKPLTAGQNLCGVFSRKACIPSSNRIETCFETRPKIIHLDADLFSSTIFVLSQLYPYLKKGDIIFFDEFNVANHEFLAFKIFTESFYVKLRPDCGGE